MKPTNPFVTGGYRGVLNRIWGEGGGLESEADVRAAAESLARVDERTETAARKNRLSFGGGWGILRALSVPLRLPRVRGGEPAGAIFTQH